MTVVAMTNTCAARRKAWLSQLRTACVIVSEQPPYLVKSISVTQHLASVPADERRELLDIAVRLAGEYGLKAETLDRGLSVTVWISRAPAAEPEAASATVAISESGEARQSLAARVLRLLKPRR